MIYLLGLLLNSFIMKNVFTLLCLHGFVLAASAQLTTTPVSNLQATVLNNLVANGINVTNILYKGHTSAIGEFNCNGCNMGLSSGVVLSSGNVNTAGGLNNNTGTSGVLSDSTDADLQNISTGSVRDAAVLEFDYQIATDSVEITFVFASEEYNEYVNSAFNDIFAFFVSGQGINNENIALVPGTTIPITINNVNNGNTNPSTGPCTNCQYFVDNTGGTTVSFDAFTTVITGKRAAIPGAVYHMKLAIADVGDQIFDSGVFIAGNSIGAKGTAPIYINGNRIAQTTTINKCDTEIITITAPPGGTYLWSTGETTQAINVIQDGVYKLNLSFGGYAVAESDSVIIVNSLTSPVQPVITLNAGTLTSSSSTGNQWFLNGQSIPGANSQTFILLSTGSYTVQVTDAGTGCFSDMSSPFLFTSVNDLTQQVPFNVIIDQISSSIRLEINEGFEGNLKLYNALGAEIINSEITAGENIINIPVKGVYFINLISDKGIYTQKVVIN